MLASLYIKNFAIVSHLELDFTDKMTAFTGETGAGKSIMIDALMLALGERADSSIVRVGEEKCEVQANFLIDKDSQATTWLKENNIDCEDGEVFLRRVIFAEGRSKLFINGVNFPIQKVKELSETLVDIHGQHQHQSLLNHTTHRKQLDEYANHYELLANTKKLFQLCAEIQTKILNLSINKNNHEKLELLQYQINEFNNLALQENEIEDLYKEHQLLHHAKEYIELAQKISATLQDDDNPNIRKYLNDIFHYLQQLPQENIYIKNTNELINNALIQCDEALNEVVAFSSQIQSNPERLNQIETRIGELHNLARKHQIDIMQLSCRETELKEELKLLENISEQASFLEKELQLAKLEYEKAAMLLRESRKKNAIKLAEEITQIIRNLGMPKGYIKIEITPLEKMHAHGLDKVEYKVCTNPGMREDSLAKIISGGELSRISLAIQMITAQHGSTPTLIFDEVDVGIGGATAALVGQLLRNLGERLQVFCVTHQAQVAANAHQHFLVEKTIKNQQTFTNIKSLLGDNKINEIARMLGGLTITEQTKLHAKELLTI